MDKTLSVLQLNTFILRIIEKEGLLHNINVYGEISAISGAHAYFTLKDKDAQISCVCFNARKTYVPSAEGESVIIQGSIDYYVKGGKLSLNVNTIQPVGKGLLHIKLEQLKLKLQAEGLFAAEHKKPIPRFAKRVAVVTSVSGAVIRDIITTVRKKNSIIDIDVFDVRVQGDTASSDIIRGLTAVDNLAYDCIILARGGGSLEDLMPFNDERLARVIYALNTPIVSAVGHETDFSISDFVADARAATPTAAAELVAYDALNRNESCGGHFREEYQTEEGEAKRDDENFFYVACWEYQGDDENAPVLYKEPLVYEAIKVQTRNYKS
jgi:exodeoxyribonuclease VII large subunit